MLGLHAVEATPWGDGAVGECVFTAVDEVGMGAATASTARRAAALPLRGRG